MLKIITVDDEQDNLLTTSALLASAFPDGTILTAQSGVEAIEKIRDELPDAILLDIRMPVMDGFETCRRLKSDSRTRHIPVIMLSAMGNDTVTRVKGLEVGADAFLAKPFAKEEMVAQVKVMLRIKETEDLLRKEKQGLQEAHDELTLKVAQIEKEVAHRLHAEGDLRESEKRYRTLFEDSNQAKSLTQDGRIIEVNRPWLALHGLKEIDEAIGKDILAFISPKDRHILSARRKKWPKEMEPVYEITDIRKDGSEVPVEVYSSRIAVDGKDAILAAIHDISKRKQAEEVIRDSERRYRSLVESTDDSIYLVNSECRYLFVNGRHLSRLGCRIDEAIGHRYAEFHSKADAEAFRLKVEDVFSTGRSTQHEHRSDRDGTFFIRTFSPVREVGGKPIYVTVISKDITARKQTEEKLREAEREATKLTKFLQKLFGRYVSDEVMESLLKDPSGLNLGGEKKRVSIMISDLRGFTGISEHMSPEDVVRMLNTYFKIMVDIIDPYQGTIIEILGDSLFVIFGAPKLMADRAQGAIACAISMQNAMDHVNEENRARGLPELEMGIGLHDAEVIVGNIGSDKRVKYSVVGNGVNLTSRIEAYTVGGQIFISEPMHQQVGEKVRISAQMDILPKGTERPLRIYGVSGISGRFNIALEERSPALVTLAREIPVWYRGADVENAEKKTFKGTVVRLSENSAEILFDTPVEILANLRMNLGNVDERLSTKGFYGKIIECGEEDGQIGIVRFTSVPPEIDSYFQSHLQHAVTPPDD
ncbi:MAG: PAS domain S-box protein [Desulfobacterales bacterium]